MSQPLELIDFSGDVLTNKEALLAKEKALELSREVVEVTDEFTAEIAKDTVRDLKGIISKVESVRKQLKAPVLELGKKIDGCAKDYVLELSQEFNRVDKLISGYAREQLRIQREEREKQLAEQRRLEAEKELQRKKLAEAETAEQKAEVQEEIQTTVKAVADIQTEVKQKPKVEGVTVREFKNYEILNILELAQARPDLVVITAKRKEILAEIKAKPDQVIPGIRTFDDASTSVRKG